MTAKEYQVRAKAARRQAAMDRREDDYRQDEGYKAIYEKEAGR